MNVINFVLFFPLRESVSLDIYILNLVRNLFWSIIK